MTAVRNDCFRQSQSRTDPGGWKRTCLELPPDFDRETVDCPADTSAATYLREFSGPRVKTTVGWAPDNRASVHFSSYDV